MMVIMMIVMREIGGHDLRVIMRRRLRRGRRGRRRRRMMGGRRMREVVIVKRRRGRRVLCSRDSRSNSDRSMGRRRQRRVRRRRCSQRMHKVRMVELRGWQSVTWTLTGVARLARTWRGNVEEGGGTVALESEKVFLSVGTDLHGGFSGDFSFDGFPFAAVEGEGVDEALVLVVGPVFAAFGEDVFFARLLLEIGLLLLVGLGRGGGV